MNEGARLARGDVLWFVHADSQLPYDAAHALLDGLAYRGSTWGRFDVALDAPGVLFRVTERLMNGRSRLTGIVTGDQGMFVRRTAFFEVGGFSPLPLMEDVALSTRLKRLGRPLALRLRIRTSARRWQRRGPLRTILLMWRLRLAFALGADPSRLARAYGHCASPTPES
jgi:rSAM/selenodomain-associated transferase 2